jgi:hypothetical protein
LIGTNETAGSALGDKVTFGAAATAKLVVGTGAEAGSTINNAIIGLTEVVKAADGMVIDFSTFGVTTSHFIADETTVVASATTLKAAENAAVNAFGSSGVAYFSFKGSEYFIATNNAEAAVSSNDAIVELVGVTDIHHATNNFGCFRHLRYCRRAAPQVDGAADGRDAYRSRNRGALVRRPLSNGALMADAIQTKKLKGPSLFADWKNRPYAKDANAEQRRQEAERWSALNEFIRRMTVGSRPHRTTRRCESKSQKISQPS